MSEAHARLLSLAQQARSSQATKRRSLPVAAKRDGGGVGLPGTGSPRKILALERCKQHEIAAYQRWISADGSRPKAAARLCASFLMKPTVSFAQKPCLSNDASEIKRMQASSSLSIKHRMICIFLACFLLSNFSSRVLAASVSLGACVRANRIYVRIPATRNTEEAYIRLCATCGPWPSVYPGFPLTHVKHSPTAPGMPSRPVASWQ